MVLLKNQCFSQSLSVEKAIFNRTWKQRLQLQFFGYIYYKKHFNNLPPYFGHRFNFSLLGLLAIAST